MQEHNERTPGKKSDSESEPMNMPGKTKPETGTDMRERNPADAENADREEGEVTRI